MGILNRILDKYISKETAKINKELKREKLSPPIKVVALYSHGLFDKSFITEGQCYMADSLDEGFPGHGDSYHIIADNEGDDGWYEVTEFITMRDKNLQELLDYE